MSGQEEVTLSFSLLLTELGVYCAYLLAEIHQYRRCVHNFRFVPKGKQIMDWLEMLSWELLFFQTVTEFYFVLYESKLYREPFQGRAMLIFSKIPKKENKKERGFRTYLLSRIQHQGKELHNQMSHSYQPVWNLSLF